MRFNHLLAIILGFIFTSLDVISQTKFQIKLPKSNLVIQRIDSTNTWRFLTDLDAKELGTVQSDCCFVRLLENKLWVYSASKNDWLNPTRVNGNSLAFSSNALFYEKLHETFQSFWIQESKKHVILHQTKDRFQNNGLKYIQPSKPPILYLGGNPLLKFSEHHTQFAVIEKSTVFQVDTLLHIWRSIKTSNSISPWSNRPPTGKFLSGYLTDFPTGNLSYLGRKNKQFLYQIYQQEKSGLILVDTSLNAFYLVAASKYDFISPSLNWDSYLVVKDNKVELTNSTFTASKLLGELSSKPIVFNPSNSNRTVEISLLKGGNILYNDYAKDYHQPSSGIFSTSQHIWFMMPEHQKLTAFPNWLVETLPQNKESKTYNLYSENGYSLYQKVKPNTKAFVEFISTLANEKASHIKELDYTSSNNSTKVTFRVNKIWHSMNLETGEIITKLIAK